MSRSAQRGNGSVRSVPGDRGLFSNNVDLGRLEARAGNAGKDEGAAYFVARVYGFGNDKSDYLPEFTIDNPHRPRLTGDCALRKREPAVGGLLGRGVAA